MESQAFSIDSEQKGNAHILHLKGYLDASTSQVLDEKMQELLAHSENNMLIDCANLSYISSAGLGIFMKHIDAVRKAGGDIIFCSMQKPVFTVFDLLGFPILYKIFDDPSVALSHFTAKE